jgi:hypothetical protein
MLVNFRIDRETIQRQLPAPFRPKPHEGAAIAGICLIRLDELRPRHALAGIGVSSESAAHRVAVVWTGPDGVEREGVYIPLRDTNSFVNRAHGGRLFPGVHHVARFDVQEVDDAIDFAMRADDGETVVRLRAREADRLPESSGFHSLEEASAFFLEGAIGYSAGSDRLEWLRLETAAWRVSPLVVDEVFSSYFADERRFPAGTVSFACALIMRDIPHEWHALAPVTPGQLPAD